MKNLPLNLDEEKFRKHFEAKSPVTDVRLMRNRMGQSRRFGFIGFKSEEDAEKVVKYFNGSFINTARISVEIAKSFGDKDVDMPIRDKLRLKEQKIEEIKRKRDEKKAEKKNKKTKTSVIDEKDEKLKEYLEVFDSRDQAKSWANDEILKDANQIAYEEEEKAKKLAAEAEKESDDEYDDFRPSATSNQQIEEAEDEDEEMIPFGSEPTSITTKENGDEKDNEDADEDEEMIPLSEIKENDGLADNQEVSDMDWLKSRRKLIKEQTLEQAEAEEINEANETKPEVVEYKEKIDTKDVTPEPVKTEEEIVEEKILASGRLFLRNLLYTSTEDDFRELFSQYGELEEVHVAVDTRTGKSKGFAYIQFSESQDALKAYKNVDKKIFQGRLLHVLPANAKKDNRLDEFELKNLPLKKQKELRRKAAAAKQQFSWNTLYLNTDAVMESVAAKLGIKKSQLISPDSANGAVQQALAEASVIGSVRQYFESKGVDLLAFQKTKEKNDRIILIKNLPPHTNVEEIAKLFSEYGDLKKVLMPPDGGIAMVLFRHITQARAAFTKLAYKRFKTSILYLEKGPKGLFENEDDTVETEEPVGVPEKVKEAKVSANEILATAEDPSEEVSSSRASVFVKNLNFETTSQALTNLFKSLDGFLVAQVKTKPNPKKTGSVLSMGFGFVEFNSVSAANVAIAAMDGQVLDGHKLQLKLSHRGQDQQPQSAQSSKKPQSAKLLIKNVPFETTKKDLYQLFGTFGQLRSLRLPRKFNNSGARGFAFAEFLTAKEAANAMASLQGTHLLGRRLVMEYAQADAVDAEEEIARMEKKVRKQVTNETLAGMRTSGKRTIDLEGDNDELNGLDGR